MNWKDKKIAEDLTDKICSSAYFAGCYPNCKGSHEALEYRTEFMMYLYNPLIEFEENVIFMTAKELAKVCDTCEVHFIGKYVQIYRKLDWLGYIYYVHCAAPSKLFGTCYRKAKEFSFKFY